FGSCDGTGAAIYVCLGFRPRKIVVKNVEDAGAKDPVLEFNEGMELVAAMDEGFLTKGPDDTDMDRTKIAANGLSMYAGGDRIHWDSVSARWEDADGNDVSEKFVDGAFKKTATSAAYRCIGDVIDPGRSGAYVRTPPGFIIGTDADINANGEQLIWEAYR
ncbi:MAG: hypothetical protein AAGU11_09945, partial [Syntrophobacteraceae bacterium]